VARDTLLDRLVYPILRRVEFRGKRRLTAHLRAPTSGTREATLVGARLRLDLSESLQRDYFMGKFDLVELRLVCDHVRGGGDFVDVGAHIGLYAIVAARASAAAGGRALAFEPHPHSRERLLENVALNRCSNVEVVPAAAAAARGRALLRIPVAGDAAWSTIEAAPAFGEGQEHDIETTTVDEELEARNLHPSFVKIDVEGAETAVLAGMHRTLRLRPRLLIEVSGQTAAGVSDLLADYGYGATMTFLGGRSVPGARVDGLCNVLFTPEPRSRAR
jgi:FkbM family methyltransferase